MATVPPVSAPDAQGFVLPAPDNGTTGGTYPIVYPGPGSIIDRRQLAALAASIGAVLAGTVNDAQAAFSGAATQTYVNNAVATGSAPLPAVAVRMLGTRVAQVVETRADGTRNVSTFTYTGDQLLAVAQSNPTRTITYTYASGVLTGWTVA